MMDTDSDTSGLSQSFDSCDNCNLFASSEDEGSDGSTTQGLFAAHGEVVGWIFDPPGRHLDNQTSGHDSSGSDSDDDQPVSRLQDTNW